MQTKNILVTGASSGMGDAESLAKAGHRVFGAARRAIDIPGVEPIQLDLDDPASIAAAVARIDAATDGYGLDVLVNNAGFATAGALAELPDQALRAQFETNVFGLMTLTRAVLPAMIERRAGRIVNVSSVSGRIPAPILGAYHASKYALEALSDALRMELAPFGVRVVLVEPGTIRTEFASRAMSEGLRERGTNSLYTHVYEHAATLEGKFDRLAGTTAPVVRAIEIAITRKRPSARYVAPRKFALMIALVRILPTCWADAAMSRMFGLNRLGAGPVRRSRSALATRRARA
ncbi:MAG: SDR family NAD(P)-dependent oxidoreductase [Kofleriaceae bacterium]